MIHHLIKVQLFLLALVLCCNAFAAKPRCEIFSGLTVVAKSSQLFPSRPVSPQMIARTHALFGRMSDIVQGYFKAPQGLVVNLMYVNFDGGDLVSAYLNGEKVGYSRTTNRVTLSHYYLPDSPPTLPPLLARQRNAAISIQIHEIAHAFLISNAANSSIIKRFRELNAQSAMFAQRSSELRAQVEQSMKDNFSEDVRGRYRTLVHTSSAPAELADALFELEDHRNSKTLTLEITTALQPKISAARTTIENLYHRGEELLVGASNQETYQRLTALWTEIGRLEAEQREIDSEVGSLLDVLNPYDELFADAFAVVMRQDPKTMAEALNTSISPSGTRSRDFTTIFDLNLLSNLESSSSNVLGMATNPFGVMIAQKYGTSKSGAVLDLESHSLLDLSRAHFWVNYASLPMYRNQPGLVLWKLFKALSAELNARWTSPNLRNISSREANRRLMARIDLEFKSP